MQRLHEFKDDIIESSRVLDGWDERGQTTLDLLGRHTLRGVKVRQDSRIEMEDRGLSVKHLHS